MGFGVPIVLYPDGWVYSRSASDVQIAPNEWQRTFQLDEIGGDDAHAYRFQPIPSRGAIAVTYAIDPTGVAISVRTEWLAPGYTQVAILNEQSAAFDDLATGNQVTLGNWTPVTGEWARLRSVSLDTEWSLPAISGASLYAGREFSPPNFNWAGLDYVFDGRFGGADYRINVEEAQ